MAAEAKIRVSLRRSTVEMIRGFDPDATSLDDAIEDMLVAHPPKALLVELDRRERGRPITRAAARRRHGY